MRTGTIAALAALGGIGLGVIAHRIYMNDAIDSVENVLDDVEETLHVMEDIVHCERVESVEDDVPVETFDAIRDRAQAVANATGMPVFCVLRS